MNVQLIQVPYDTGHENVRAGRGPGYLIERGAADRLRARGHDTQVERIEIDPHFPAEIATAIESNRLLAEAVSAALRADRLPLVLAGNCNCCLGAVSGVGPDGVGVVWFDTHGDFNTPETTTSGFLDGMGLAMLAGRCWGALLDTLPGFQPVPDSHIVHVGARDLDPAERVLMEESAIRLVLPGEVGLPNMGRAIDDALDDLARRVERVYVHVDVDVLETGAARANRLAFPGGLPLDMVEEAIEKIKARFTIAAGALASFDPAYDVDDGVLEACFRILDTLVSDPL
jgi:arginase